MVEHGYGRSSGHLEILCSWFLVQILQSQRGPGGRVHLQPAHDPPHQSFRQCHRSLQPPMWPTSSPWPPTWKWAAFSGRIYARKPLCAARRTGKIAPTRDGPSSRLAWMWWRGWCSTGLAAIFIGPTPPWTPSTSRHRTDESVWCSLLKISQDHEASRWTRVPERGSCFGRSGESGRGLNGPVWTGRVGRVSLPWKFSGPMVWRLICPLNVSISADSKLDFIDFCNYDGSGRTQVLASALVCRASICHEPIVRLIDWFSCLVAQLFGWWLNWLIDWMTDCLLARSIDSFDWLIDWFL